jgi:metal-responsive CopG/Arc/MetJ family transcriptional regulator
MTRISVSLDDATAAALEQTVGKGSMSKWVADLVRQSLLTRAAAAAGAYDRRYDGADTEDARLAGLA